jgi:hypothetical protein
MVECKSESRSDSYLAPGIECRSPAGARWRVRVEAGLQACAEQARDRKAIPGETTTLCGAPSKVGLRDSGSPRLIFFSVIGSADKADPLRHRSLEVSDEIRGVAPNSSVSALRDPLPSSGAELGMVGSPEPNAGPCG